MAPHPAVQRASFEAIAMCRHSDNVLAYLGRLYDERGRAYACLAATPEAFRAWALRARPELRRLIGLDRIRKTDRGNLILCGGSAQGTFYAVQTLCNSLYLEDGDLKVGDLHTARFPTFNRPAFQYRGIVTNIGGPDHLSRDQWAREWQKGGEYDYRGFIDWLAEFKIKHLNVWLLELGFGIAYPSKKFPECVNRFHPNVKNEFLGEMIDYAHQKAMEVSILTDFPDMFSGILRHHPELAAKQFRASELPPQEDWEAFQKTGENKNHHSFRNEFGAVCASNPQTMVFWEEYFEEVFSRYPGLDGIMG